MTMPQVTDLTGLPLRDLLDLVGELLVGSEDDGAEEGRAGTLHQAMQELNIRAERSVPAVPVTCACGEAFASPDELDEHFWAVFVPADDKGLDGQVHAEITRRALTM